MVLAGPAGAVPFSITARANCSLTPGGRRVAFALIFAVSLGIASGFAILLGAWPVLPFAGLEMAALYLAFDWVNRHAGDFERLTVEGDVVTVEAWECARLERFRLNRHWARVVLAADPVSGHSRLALRSHGREVPFGRHLTDAERAHLAGELRRRLREERTVFE